MPLGPNSQKALEKLGKATDDTYIHRSGAVYTLVGVGATEQEVLTEEADPGFATWLAEHGGDVTLTKRRQARQENSTECPGYQSHNAPRWQRGMSEITTL